MQHCEEINQSADALAKASSLAWAHRSCIVGRMVPLEQLQTVESGGVRSFAGK